MTTYSEYQKSVGEQLAELRKASGMTQRELAEKCGVNYASIAKIESGTYNCSIAVLEKIADCLNASILLQKNRQLFTVTWGGNASMHKALTIGSEYAQFSSLDEAIAFAEAELKNDPDIAPVEAFENAAQFKLSHSDYDEMVDALEVYETIFDEDGEEVDIVTRWQSENYVVRCYDEAFFDSVIEPS